VRCQIKPPRHFPRAAVLNRRQQVLGSRKKGRLVRLSKAVHTAVFAPTGVGKGTSLIIPWLLECDESAVVIDFKGENASITAKHRRKKFGHKVELLDPWRVVTKKPATLNPLSSIDKDSPEAIDDCRDLAEQLVIKTGEEKEPHWNEAAEMWIAGAAAAVAHHAIENRSLQSVCDILSNPAKVSQLVELLCKSDGMLPRLGGQLAHFQEKELASTLTSANRHLRFLSTPAVVESTSSSSFDPSELRNGKMTVYLIIPPEHMRAAAGLMRLWIGTLMRAVVRGGLQRA
jgi:type IV secretion system protein VirD4